MAVLLCSVVIPNNDSSHFYGDLDSSNPYLIVDALLKLFSLSCYHFIESLQLYIHFENINCFELIITIGAYFPFPFNLSYLEHSF